MTRMKIARMFWAVLFCTACLILPQAAKAKPKLTPIKGASYQVKASMKDNLKTLVGKKVYVHLDSGKSLTGIMKKVGNHLIHLEKLDRKEFFDALIRIENIIAIDTQFRKYKN